MYVGKSLTTHSLFFPPYSQVTASGCPTRTSGMDPLLSSTLGYLYCKESCSCDFNPCHRQLQLHRSARVKVPWKGMTGSASCNMVVLVSSFNNVEILYREIIQDNLRAQGILISSSKAPLSKLLIKLVGLFCGSAKYIWTPGPLLVLLLGLLVLRRPRRHVLWPQREGRLREPRIKRERFAGRHALFGIIP